MNKKQIVKSSTEPPFNNLWLKGEKLYEFTSKGWTPISGGGEGTEDTSTIKKEIDKIKESVGKSNGIAPLDGNGKVSSQYLPSYVDDVLEFDNFKSLPSKGEAGKIYVTVDDNKTYRWSGSSYIEISKSIELGETSESAFPGDRGKELEHYITETTKAYKIINREDKVILEHIEKKDIDFEKDFVILMKDGSLYVQKDAVWETTPWMTWYNTEYRDILWEGVHLPKFAKILSYGQLGSDSVSCYGFGIKDLPPTKSGERRKYTGLTDVFLGCNFDDYGQFDFSEVETAPYGGIFQSKIPFGSIFSFDSLKTGNILFAGCHFDEEPGLYQANGGDENSYPNLVSSNSAFYKFKFPVATSLVCVFDGCKIHHLDHIAFEAPNVTNINAMFAFASIGYCKLPNFLANLDKVTSAINLFFGAHFNDDGVVQLHSTYIPLPNCKDWTGAFRWTNIRQFWNGQFSKATNVSRLFEDCFFLENVQIPSLGYTDNGKGSVTSVNKMLYRCNKLKYVDINMANVENASGMFTSSATHQFKHLTTLKLPGLKVNIDLSHLIALSTESIDEIITNAATVTNKTITLNTNIKDRVTDEIVEKATAKGWKFAYSTTNDLTRFFNESFVLQEDLTRTKEDIKEAIDNIDVSVENLPEAYGTLDYKDCTPGILSKEMSFILNQWYLALGNVGFGYWATYYDGSNTEYLTKHNKDDVTLSQNIRKLGSYSDENPMSYFTQTATLKAATSEHAGIMTSTDKVNLDATKATVDSLPNSLKHINKFTALDSYVRCDIQTYSKEDGKYISTTNSGLTLAAASTSRAGVMSSADKAKLDSLTQGVTEERVNELISNVVGAAPEALDTLEEIADKLKDNDDAVAGIVNTISTKASTSDLDNYYNKEEVEAKIANATTDYSLVSAFSDVYDKYSEISNTEYDSGDGLSFINSISFTVGSDEKGMKINVKTRDSNILKEDGTFICEEVAGSTTPIIIPFATADIVGGLITNKDKKKLDSIPEISSLKQQIKNEFLVDLLRNKYSDHTIDYESGMILIDYVPYEYWDAMKYYHNGPEE